VTICLNYMMVSDETRTNAGGFVSKTLQLTDNKENASHT